MSKKPYYEVQLRCWSSPETLEGSRMGIYKRVLCLMPKAVTNTWYDEVQNGRKNNQKFITPFEVNGKVFETSMSGVRAEKYTERLLNIALAMGEIDFYRKIGNDGNSRRDLPSQGSQSQSSSQSSSEMKEQKPESSQSSSPEKRDENQGGSNSSSGLGDFSDAIKRAQEQQERERAEKEQKAKEEREKKAKEEAEKKAKEEKERKEREKRAGEKPKWYSRALLYAKHGLNIYLYGEAGTGKGYNSRKIACELNPETDEHEVFYQVNKVGDEYQLLGFNDAQGRYVGTRFYEACKYASEHPDKSPLFMFDEMDVSSPDSLKCFNEAVAAKEMTFPNGEFLKFPNLVFFAAGNTLGNGSTEKYTANNIDKSTLDRYAIVETDYETKIELLIADGDRELVDFIDEFRKETRKESLPIIVSYRSIERLNKMKASGIDCDVLLKDCLLKGLSSDDVRMISENLRIHNKWTMALRKCAA